MKLLCVEDDRDAADLLTFILGRAGFEVVAADDPATALRLVDEARPALVLLDVNLGAYSGFDVLRELRRRSGVPVIMVTGRTAEDDKVHALEAGADDYVTKPYNQRELVARIRAVLRRTPERAAVAEGERAGSPGVLESGPVRMNVRDYSVAVRGQPVSLALTEFRLLHHLMARAGAVVPREELLTQLWGADTVETRESLRVMVYRLRQKLGDPANPSRLIHTSYGRGFMFKPVPDESPRSGPSPEPL
jgi:two-component system response regulator RegX3